jgi:hypothetical protein
VHIVDEGETNDETDCLFETEGDLINDAMVRVIVSQYETTVRSGDLNSHGRSSIDDESGHTLLTLGRFNCSSQGQRPNSSILGATTDRCIPGCQIHSAQPR